MAQRSGEPTACFGRPPEELTLDWAQISPTLPDQCRHWKKPWEKRRAGKGAEQFPLEPVSVCGMLYCAHSPAPAHSADKTPVSALWGTANLEVGRPAGWSKGLWEGLGETCGLSTVFSSSAPTVLFEPLKKSGCHSSVISTLLSRGQLSSELLSHVGATRWWRAGLNTGTSYSVPGSCLL